MPHIRCAGCSVDICCQKRKRVCRAVHISTTNTDLVHLAFHAPPGTMQGKLCSVCYREVQQFQMTGGHYQVRTVGPSRKGKRPRPVIASVKRVGPPKRQRKDSNTVSPTAAAAAATPLEALTAAAAAQTFPSTIAPQAVSQTAPTPAIVLTRNTFSGNRHLCSNVCNTLADFLHHSRASSYVHIDINVLWGLLQQIQGFQRCPTPNCRGFLQICRVRMEGLCLSWNWHCYRCTNVQQLSTCPVRTRTPSGVPGPYHINVMAMVACLQTGLTYTKLNSFFNTIGQRFISQKSFYRFQHDLYPTMIDKMTKECFYNLRVVLDYIKSIGDTNLECSFDCAWGTRGFKSTHGVTRMMPSKRHTPPSMTSIPVIWNGILSKPRTRAAHPARPTIASTSPTPHNTVARVQLNNGTHTQSSKSMETMLMTQALQEIQSFLTTNNYSDIKLDVCVDGSAAILNILTKHPLMHRVYRDRAHVGKSIHKHIIKQLKKPHTIVMKKQIIASVKKWFNIVLYVAVKESWSEQQARNTFLLYILHKTNDHEFCLPTSRCRGANYNPGPLTDYFVNQDEPFISAMLKALVLVWPDNPNFNLVTQLSTSYNESMNQSACRVHPKHTDFAASFADRDRLAVMMNNRGRRYTTEAISQDWLGVPLRPSHIQLLDRLDQSKQKDQRRYQTRRQKRLLSIRQDAQAAYPVQSSSPLAATAHAVSSPQPGQKRRSDPNDDRRKHKIRKTIQEYVKTTKIFITGSNTDSDSSDCDTVVRKQPSPTLVFHVHQPRVYLCSKCRVPKKGHACSK